MEGKTMINQDNGVSMDSTALPSAAPSAQEDQGSQWLPIETAPRSDDENPPAVLILRNGRRYIAEYDADAGYFFGVLALDENEFGAVPGRLYGATHWHPLPSPPTGRE